GRRQQKQPAVNLNAVRGHRSALFALGRLCQPLSPCALRPRTVETAGEVGGRGAGEGTARVRSPEGRVWNPPLRRRSRAPGTRLPIPPQQALGLPLGRGQGLLGGGRAGQRRLDRVVQQLPHPAGLVGRKFGSREFKLVAGDGGLREVLHIGTQRFGFVGGRAGSEIAGRDAPLRGPLRLGHPPDEGQRRLALLRRGVL